MVNKKHIVELNVEEREFLRGLVTKGKAAAQTLLKARILLRADQSEAGAAWRDEAIAEALETSVATVERVRKACVCEGIDAALTRKKRATPPRPRTFDGEAEARLIALACSDPPEGHARWTIRLLAEKVVELEIVETTHFTTVCKVLKKRTQAASQEILGHSA